MRKTTVTKERLENKKTIDTVGLQSMLSCGRKSAIDIGSAAGARIQVGRRVLWNVSKVQKYIDEISE